MSYAHQVLGVNENIIKEAKISKFAFLKDWFAIFILAIVFFDNIDSYGYSAKQNAILSFISILAILFRIYLICKINELVLTNRKVITKTGFIRRYTVELRLEKIESFAVDQGVLGRIFNYGTITIMVAGSLISVSSIHAPIEFKKLVDEHIENKLSK